MFRPRIALIVDQPQRDLAGLVLTAFDLCQRGATCYLVPTLLQRTEIWALAPDFVLLFNMRRGFEQFALKLDSARIRFGLLDVEGAVWDSCDSYAELLWDDPSVLRALSVACNWGPKMSEYLIGNGILLPHQARITGCPRFDFYNPKWRGAIHDGEFAEEEREKRILINTNSADANPRLTSLEGSKRYLARFDWPSERIRQFLDTQTRQVESTINLARDLARDYPQHKIVLRPHPFEAPDVYRQQLSGQQNVEINTSGPVQPQIFKAAAVIQRSCTTAIESALASVPTFSPRWIPTAATIEIAEKVSTPCYSYSELRCNLDALLRGAPAGLPKDALDTMADDVAKNTIRDWFYLMDGQAHHRVNDAIEDSLPTQRVVDERLCALYLYSLENSRRFSRDHVSRAIRHRLRLSPDWSFRRMRRMPSSRWVKSGYYFGVSQVAELARKIGGVLNNGHGNCKPVHVELAGGLHSYSGGSIAMTC